MSPRSTREVAALVGIHRATVEEWISKGKIRPPKEVTVGQRIFRIWTDEDIKRLREYKKESYRKGRGRKKQSSAETL